MERQIEGLMNRAVLKKVSWQKRREMRSLSVCVCVDWRPQVRTNTHNPHFINNSNNSALAQSAFPLFVLFLQLFFLMTLILSIDTLISYSLHLPISPANSSKLKPQLIHLCLFFYFTLEEESNHHIYHSDFSAIHFTITMARSNSPPALLPLNFLASFLLTLSPFIVACLTSTGP